MQDQHDQDFGMEILRSIRLDDGSVEPYATFSRVEARLPDGREWNENPLVSVRPAAAVLVFNEATRHLTFVRQGRIGTGGRKVTEAPAGGIDPGEDPQDAASREVEEETGLTLVGIKWLATYNVSPGYSDEVMHCFIAVGTPGGTRSAEDAHVELVEVLLDDLERLIESTRRGGDGKTLMLLLLLAHDLRTNPELLENIR
jgi:ADP-ribose pyrophosphatase